jgi:hypothetical protein
VPLDACSSPHSDLARSSDINHSRDPRGCFSRQLMERPGQAFAVNNIELNSALQVDKAPSFSSCDPNTNTPLQMVEGIG